MKDCKGGAQFIFTALGAAFGLGNTLRFPALCLFYGGAFVIAYVLVLAVFALPLLYAELAAGRTTRRPFSHLLKRYCRAGKAVGDAACLNSAAIVVYYITIISLLAVRACTFYGSINYGYPSDIPAATPFFAALCCLALAFFLTRASEKRAKIAAASVCLQTAFFIALAVRGLMNEQSMQALALIFSVNFSLFTQVKLWTAALGQALLSLSLAAGVMPSFAADMPNGAKPLRFAAIIIFANIAGGLLSSVATLTLAYGCGMLDGISGSGIDNAFEIFPAALQAAFGEGEVAGAVGSAFYAVLALTAFVSALSLARPAYVRLSSSFSPPAAALALCVCFFALGLPFSLGADYSAADYICCNIVAPLVAAGECLCFCAGFMRRKNSPAPRGKGKKVKIPVIRG